MFPPLSSAHRPPSPERSLLLLLLLLSGGLCQACHDAQAEADDDEAAQRQEGVHADEEPRHGRPGEGEGQEGEDDAGGERSLPRENYTS